MYIYIHVHMMCTYILLWLYLSLQWVVVEQSCNSYSRVLVPLYDTLGSDAVSYIINQSKSL